MNFVSRNNPKELSSTALTLVTLSFASFIANGVLAQEIGREVELEPITVQASTEMARKRTTTIGALSEEAAGGFTAKGARLGQLGNREIAKTPFSITAFTAKAIRDQQAQTIIDIVRNDPSVRSDAPAFSDRDSFVIRGFPITGDNTFFDGQANIANARRVHLEGIERVEALKGPSAMLSGGIGRVGGSINVIPKRADDEPLTRLTTTYASKSQLGNHIDIGRRFGENGEWGVRGNAAYRFGKTALDHNEIKVGALALGLDYRGDDLRATLDIQHGSQKLDAPTSLFNTAKPNVVIPKAPKGSINTGNPFEYHDSRQSFIAGRVEYDLNEDTTIYAAGGASRYYEDFLTSNFVLTDNNGVGYGEFGYNPMRFTGYNGEIGLRTSFDTGAIGHDLSLSATKSVFENNRGRFHPRILGFKEFGTNIFKPSYVPSNFVDTSPAPRSNDLYPFADLHSTSLAISDTLSFSEGFVELTLGGRYQKMRSRGFNTRPGNAAYPVGEITI